MPNPICEKCVPNKTETHAGIVEDLGCRKEYDVVNTCMKESVGNIASCKDQWDAFRKCYADKKKAT